MGFYAGSSAGWHLAETYTADVPGSPVALHSRSFSLGIMPEVCSKSPAPSKLVLRDPIRLRVGQRIERMAQVPENSQDDVIVDAYDEHGTFLPHVPVTISVLDPQGILAFRSDGDYVEAVAVGEAGLEVFWACASPEGPVIQARARVIVTD